jgi:tetratricopeptide (TPR) repeat protein
MLKKENNMKNRFELNKDLQSELDELMQEGYKILSDGDSVGAATVWSKLWNKFVDTMIMYQIEFVDDLDRSFHGLQSIYNWAQDFEMELANASHTDKRFAHFRIDFCTEYIARSQNRNKYNVLAMKRVIAETYFLIGQQEEGDQLFEEYLKEDPTSGWGWIKWSDQYGILTRGGEQNSEKAINILLQALEVKGLEDRIAVLERLHDTYYEFDMIHEADEVGKEMDRLSREKRMTKTTKSIKVSRNEPCPCGSGKKYKKCCG